MSGAGSGRTLAPVGPGETLAAAGRAGEEAYSPGRQGLYSLAAVLKNGATRGGKCRS